MEGEENKNTERIRKFGNELEKRSEKPLEFFDERFTTKEAASMGGDSSLDEKSAMLVLQDYLSD